MAVYLIFLGLNASSRWEVCRSTSSPAPSSVLGNLYTLLKNTAEETGAWLSGVTHLPHKPEDLSSDTSMHIKFQRWPCGCL